ncbi:hypothetical protein E7T06_18490 [Deinococcus sp. Arct2-2]|uniref:hypothetical protein n=1 Tax=Deinococcus sp. Arct2-2 TaxID=2568653 RepID=UPI0010A37AC6|nr:hypothetical protein [Deinococcus sp. Arct2-2]THF68027.1 hypothetical protein E7T06_18490 [Deinococcus sp. Arct2-2]
MPIKSYGRPTRNIELGEGESFPRVVEVVPDVFTHLWIRYEDSSWRWVDLTWVVELNPFLRDPTIFQQGRLREDQGWVEWPGGIRLSVSTFVGVLNKVNRSKVFVRAASDRDFGWFRPLTIDVRTSGKWAHLAREIGDGQTDLEALASLGFSTRQIERVLAAYLPVGKVVAARVLDLMLCLMEPDTGGGETLQQWLARPWRLSTHTTPNETIEQGEIAWVERLVVSGMRKPQNFTT